MAVRRTAATSIAVAVLLFAVLTLQAASGRDPGLSASRTGAGGSPSAPAVQEPSTTALVEEDDDQAPVVQPPVVQQQIPVPAPVQTSTS